MGLPTLLIAIGVLAASGALLWFLVRRAGTGRMPVATHGPAAARSAPVASVLDSVATMGQAMIGSGYPVNVVQTALEDILTAQGARGAQAVVLPTSIVVSADEDGRSAAKAVAAGAEAYTLAQVDMIDTIQTEARAGGLTAAAMRDRLDAVTALPAPFTRRHRLAAYPAISASIAVLLGASWAGVLVAAVLGAGVGLMLILGETVSQNYTALIVVGAALGVGVVGLLAARTSLDPGVLPSVVAPLVMFLPGGLLTTGVIELATGHVVSGSARIAAGAMRLLLLAVGIVTAGSLVGVPEIELEAGAQPLGPVAPWIAVAVFGIGIVVFQSALPRSLGWILLVLYVAYGAQVVGDLFLDGVLSALVGAAVMTPVAVLVARQRTGPPTIVSFLPAFWLLVPGALGLVGVTGILDGSGAGASTIVTTAATMIAIALGVLLGLAVTSSLRRGASPAVVPEGEPDGRWAR